MLEKICRRCGFYVQPKSKGCPICGYRYFYVFDLNEQQAADEPGALSHTYTAVADLAQTMIKKIAMTASSFFV